MQLLFADASTGARSPALVKQGQIGELINAKPEARRKILEEAAGISGLHTRRHDAELRLRGAESNLEKVDDSLETLHNNLRALKRQAGAPSGSMATTPKKSMRPLAGRRIRTSRS